jgi:hypothetical protein
MCYAAPSAPPMRAATVLRIHANGSGGGSGSDLRHNPRFTETPTHDCIEEPPRLHRFLLSIVECGTYAPHAFPPYQSPISFSTPYQAIHPVDQYVARPRYHLQRCTEVHPIATLKWGSASLTGVAFGQ